MNTPTEHACRDFAEDISAFVDGELEPASVGRLTAHVRACTGCHEAVDTLRRLSGLHRHAVAVHDEQLVESVDAEALLAGIQGNLLEEKREGLARLFYELGKAYVIAGNKDLGERERASLEHCAPPREIRGAESRARALLREAEDLAVLAPAGARRTPALFRRSRQLFARARTARSGALDRGRRFLEEALAVDAGLDEARLYLGFMYSLVGRPDRARVLFRRVHARGRTALLRLMALQSLGLVYDNAGDHRQAARCFAEVVASDEALGEAGLFPSFVNLPVSCAKAGLVDESVEHFVGLAERFPRRLAQIRGLLSRKRYFAATLERNDALRDDLRRRVPALFAA